MGFYTEYASLKLTDVSMEGLLRPIVEHEAVYTATRPTDMPVPEPEPPERA